MKLKTLYTATALIIASGVASADPITITTGAFGTTNQFDALGTINTPVTSVYTNNGNISQGSEATDLVGQTLAFSDMGTSTIGQFSPLMGSAATAGYGDDWVLDFTYTLNGFMTFIDDVFNTSIFADGSMDANGDGTIDPFDAVVPTYTDGTYEFFYRTLTGPVTNTKVLEIDLVNFDVAGANVVLDSEVDYSWYTAGGPSSTLIENFFTDVQSGNSFYELATATPEPQEISFQANFNVNPNNLPTCVDAACTTLERVTKINLSGAFAKVPEPTSIAILGLGLLGLGFRRKTKV